MNHETSNGAIPLKDAMRQWLPAEVQAAIQTAYEDGKQNAREVSWIDADGMRRSGIDDTSDNNRPLIQRFKAAVAVAEAQFRAILRAGRLVAWGREGSPLAPLRRIPADAWTSLRLTNVRDGRAGGAGVELFGLYVAEAVAQVEPAPAVPSLPEAASSPPPKAPSTPIESAAEAWMRANVTDAGAWRRDAAIKACMEEAPAPYRQSLAAWKALDQALRRGRGRPRAAK